MALRIVQRHIKDDPGAAMGQIHKDTVSATPYFQCTIHITLRIPSLVSMV